MGKLHYFLLLFSPLSLLSHQLLELFQQKVAVAEARAANMNALWG